MAYKVIPIHQIQTELSAVSPTMCLAKWTQSTIHLNTGHTHSCHHPTTHKIPLDELELSTHALHNTKHKQRARQDLLDGVQTSECDYCWKIENLDIDHTSDRIFKSRTSWSYPKFDEVLASGVGAEFFPSYIEVNFDNTCNFRCLYCSPEVSSRWMEDSLKGPYVLPNQVFNDLNYFKQISKMPYSRREVNPYVDAFWKWWPELKTKLTHFRITGGEPLLSKNTWRILEDLVDNPQPDLDLAINTNMCVPDDLISRLIELIHKLNGKISRLTIFTSTEGDGPEQEFVRDGMDMDRFWKNVDTLLEQCPTVRLAYMTTINVFSIRTLPQFVARAINQRARYTGTDEHRISLSFNYLRHPSFLALPTMKPGTLNVYMKMWRDSAEKLANKSLYGKAALNDQERESWERIIDWALAAPHDESGKQDQVEFINQILIRRPELSSDVAQWVLDN